MDTPTGNKTKTQASPSLIRRLRDGDNQAWTQLVDKYANRLEMLARKMDALSRRREGPEEIVNSVFKSLCRRLTDKDSPSIQDISLFLKGMVVNRLHERRAKNTAQKRDARRELHDAGMVNDLLSRKETPSVIVQCREEFCRILGALNPVEQAIFELALDGNSTKEIARTLDYSERSIQLYKRRIQKKVESLGYERPQSATSGRAPASRSLS
jgi:RNA polymerase sigma factor (sigma-70 family)